jgi:hypothetical protein
MASSFVTTMSELSMEDIFSGAKSGKSSTDPVMPAMYRSP